SYQNRKEIDSSINTAVDEIVAKIVEEHPDLVAGVESGTQSRRLLENKIKELVIDKKLYKGSVEEFIQKVFDVLFGYGPLQPNIE
ncbi:CpaF family protein, partial [Thermoanaerobacter thermohydrosulfuricus]